jgi:Fe-Mn family superoxide dismutase
MDIDTLIKNLDKVPKEVSTKVKNNAGGHVNHSLFWTLMGPKTGGEPKGELIEAVKSTFGSFDKFKEKFSASALNHFGSGWAWLTLSDGKLSIEDTSNQDTPLTLGRKPILTIDVWEHAYYLKYQNRRIEYIEAFWSIINWPEVEKNYLEALAK